ncbi:MAG: hypothetical protein NZ750_12055 [Anaerolineae bacterium]|nr:hypothetical protein [Anaerolineae bacterium]MDW8173904.1 hypothetical protein [Anaerolineae bacterium]
MDNDFIVGAQRRKIEDAIMARFKAIRFDAQHTYLEDEQFWDFIFSWYELAHYYEQSGDNTLGAHMLELYQACVERFKQSAQDKRLSERRRDKAADAIYQISYYVNQMTFQARRNGIERQPPTGEINWKPREDHSEFN